MKLAPVKLIFIIQISDKKQMRSFAKKARFLLFPLLSLGIVSTFTLFTMGFIKVGAKKNDITVFEKVDELKRHVASVNKSIEQLGLADTAEQAAAVKNSDAVMGELHMEMGSPVRSLIQTGCAFDTLEKSVASSQIKFDFIDCENSTTKMKLINKTNGYEAQIFGIRGKKVSSDFIQLEHGANELIFEISSTAGQIKLQTIKIKRIQ